MTVILSYNYLFAAISARMVDNDSLSNLNDSITFPQAQHLVNHSSVVSLAQITIPVDFVRERLNSDGNVHMHYRCYGIRITPTEVYVYIDANPVLVLSHFTVADTAEQSIPVANILFQSLESFLPPSFPGLKSVFLPVLIVLETFATANNINPHFIKCGLLYKWAYYGPFLD